MGVTVRPRGESWNVFWPLGGGRSAKGKTQSTTWPDETTARQAAAIVKAKKQAITKPELEDLILGRIDLPPEASSPCPTLRAWVTEWMPSRTRPAPSWRATAESMWRRRILPFTPAGSGVPLGDRPMDLITGIHVGQLVHDLRTTPTPKAPHGLRETTVTRHLSELNAAYAAAIRAQRTTHVTINPCRESDFRRDQVAHDDDGTHGHHPVYLTPAQFRRLRDEFHPHYRPLLDVLVGTGQRWSEATAMAVGAVELAPRRGGAQVRIMRAWKKGQRGHGDRYLGPTKGKKARVVPLQDMLLPTVAALVDGRRPKDFLLVGPGGKPYDYANFYHQAWRPAVTRAARCRTHPPADRGGAVGGGEADRGPLCGDWGGMKEERGRPVKPCGMKRVPGGTRCRWHMGPPPDAVSDCGCLDVVPADTGIHDLRHSFAAWYLAGGGDIRRLQDLLGHESITTTEIYSGLLPGGDSRVVAALDATWAAG